MMDLVGIEDIQAAAVALEPILRPTPLEESPSLARLVGRRVLFKPEHRQLTGSFKIRGAYNKIFSLEPGAPVVAASAGNHAQGVARAARLTRRAATIFMPSTAALPKVAATKADGAEVRLVDGVVDDSVTAAREFASQTGGVFVHPFDDPAVIAGQGTVGMELVADLTGDEEPVILVPIGGGGLVSGVAAAVRGSGLRARLVGVEASGAPAMQAAMRARQPQELIGMNTIADGIAVRSVSQRTLAHCESLLDDVVTVDDDDIARACLLLLERAKAVVEPAGAVGLAALLSGKVKGSAPAVVVLSGGNVDPLILSRLIEHGLTAAGRFLVLKVDVEDRPGALANLTSRVAEMGLNVLSVEHHRLGMRLGLDKVEVQMTVETRDPAHREETLKGLRASGLGIELVD